MEIFEQKALEAAPHRPSVWFRYVDDTFVKIHQNHIDEFTKQINMITSQDPNINFNTEPECDRKHSLTLEDFLNSSPAFSVTMVLVPTISHLTPLDLW